MIIASAGRDRAVPGAASLLAAAALVVLADGGTVSSRALFSPLISLVVISLVSAMEFFP